MQVKFVSGKFDNLPFVEITADDYMSLLESKYLITLDRYHRTWVMVQREVGIIAAVVATGTKKDILYVDPIVRVKIIVE